MGTKSRPTTSWTFYPCTKPCTNWQHSHVRTGPKNRQHLSMPNCEHRVIYIYIKVTQVNATMDGWDAHCLNKQRTKKQKKGNYLIAPLLSLGPNRTHGIYNDFMAFGSIWFHGQIMQWLHALNGWNMSLNCKQRNKEFLHEDTPQSPSSKGLFFIHLSTAQWTKHIAKGYISKWTP